MHMQLNEQFIIDERGSKQAVIIPFAKYLKLLEILSRYDEPLANNNTNIWQSSKGSKQAVNTWLTSDSQKSYPMTNASQLELTVQEIRDAWGDE